MAQQPWKRIEPTEIIKAGYRTITEKHFELPSGLVVDRSIVNKDGWAASIALALTPDNKVIIARQFRPGPEKFMHELPGGIVDENESPEACVIRELEEETGYKPGNIEYLGASYYDAYTNGERHNFLLTDCTYVENSKESEPDEDIEVRLIGIEELLAIAKRGELTDPGAVLMAYDKLKKLAEDAQ